MRDAAFFYKIAKKVSNKVSTIIAPYTLVSKLFILSLLKYTIVINKIIVNDKIATIQFGILTTSYHMFMISYLLKKRKLYFHSFLFNFIIS